MSENHATRIPSLLKKYLMAGSGLVLVGFVLGHMLGNLQLFAGSPVRINLYGHLLQSLGIWLWAIRLFLLAGVGVHIWMAILLTKENRRARGSGPQVNATVQASFASRTMFWSGLIVLAFILFHLAHFTTQNVHPIFRWLKYTHEGVTMHDVYAMTILGFAEPLVALFYLVAVGLLCLHLSHGVSSMFQSVGLRNEKWRGKLNHLALAYGLVIFLGFAAVPLAVQYSLHSPNEIVPVRTIVEQVAKEEQAWNPENPTPVVVDYRLAPSAGLGQAQAGKPDSNRRF